MFQSYETFLWLPVIKEEFVQSPGQVDSLLHPGDLALVNREDWQGLHTSPGQALAQLPQQDLLTRI